MNRKHIVLVFAVLVLVTGNAHCGQLYRSDAHYFSLVFPDNWIIEKGRNPHVVVKAFPDSAKDVSVGITVEELPSKEQGLKITDLMKPDDIIAGYASRGANIVKLDSGTTTIWNEDAIWVTHLMTISHLGITVYAAQYQVATYHRGRMYCVNVSAGGDSKESALEKFSVFEPVFLQTLASFALDDWKQ